MMQQKLYVPNVYLHDVVSFSTRVEAEKLRLISKKFNAVINNYFQLNPSDQQSILIFLRSL